MPENRSYVEYNSSASEEEVRAKYEKISEGFWAFINSSQLAVDDATDKLLQAKEETYEFVQETVQEINQFLDEMRKDVSTHIEQEYFMMLEEEKMRQANQDVPDEEEQNYYPSVHDWDNQTDVVFPSEKLLPADKNTTGTYWDETHLHLRHDAVWAILASFSIWFVLVLIVIYLCQRWGYNRGYKRAQASRPFIQACFNRQREGNRAGGSASPETLSNRSLLDNELDSELADLFMDRDTEATASQSQEQPQRRAHPTGPRIIVCEGNVLVQGPDEPITGPEVLGAEVEVDQDELPEASAPPDPRLLGFNPELGEFTPALERARVTWVRASMLSVQHLTHFVTRCTTAAGREAVYQAILAKEDPTIQGTVVLGTSWRALVAVSQYEKRFRELNPDSPWGQPVLITHAHKLREMRHTIAYTVTQYVLNASALYQTYGEQYISKQSAYRKTLEQVDKLCYELIRSIRLQAFLVAGTTPVTPELIVRIQNFHSRHIADFQRRSVDEELAMLQGARIIFGPAFPDMELVYLFEQLHNNPQLGDYRQNSSPSVEDEELSGLTPRMRSPEPPPPPSRQSEAEDDDEMSSSGPSTGSGGAEAEAAASRMPSASQEAVGTAGQADAAADLSEAEDALVIDEGEVEVESEVVEIEREDVSGPAEAVGVPQDDEIVGHLEL